MGSEIPHSTNERIAVSYSRREVSYHALPTHFVKSTLRRLPEVTFFRHQALWICGKCSVASLVLVYQHFSYVNQHAACDFKIF